MLIFFHAKRKLCLHPKTQGSLLSLDQVNWPFDVGLPPARAGTLLLQEIRNLGVVPVVPGLPSPGVMGDSSATVTSSESAGDEVKKLPGLRLNQPFVPFSLTGDLWALTV